MDILFYIKDLLLKREGLVVPGLGSFIVENIPSRIDQTNNKLIPPQKNIKFNASITRDSDHILAKTLMQKENISFDEATEKINEQVENIKQTLKQNRKFEIPDVGIIERDQNDNLLFKTSKKEDRTLGLIEVEAEPFEQPKKSAKTKTASPGKPVQETSKPKEKKKKSYKLYWLLGTIVVFIGIAAATLYLDFWNLPLKEILSTKEPEKEEINEQQTSISLPDTGKVAQINQTIDTITDKKQALMYEENTSEKQKIEQPGKTYHLIVGSFQKRKNAEIYSEQIRKQGYEPEIIAKDDLFRIAVQSYDNKHQALVSLYHMRDTGKINTVWLLTVSEKDQ
ncbi:MAG: SPOR domain-containing protein [Bacteroidota bacterium]